VRSYAINHIYALILGSRMHALNHVMIAVIRIMKDSFRSIQTKILPVTHLKNLRTNNFALGIGLKSHVLKRVMFAHQRAKTNHTKSI